MRRYYFLILTAVLTLFSSCKDSLLSSEVGIGIQPENDKITVKTEAFRVKSETLFINTIHNRPDSLLLGFYDTKKYGEVEASILSQFDAPSDLTPDKRYPEGTEADSLFLLLQYSSYFGSPNSTMKVNVFELNKDKTFDYNTFYPSNINPTEYVDIDAANARIGEKVFTANIQNPRGQSGQLRIKLSETFKEKIFELSKKYQDREEFLEKFKGVFINTDLGDATILNINGINMLMHYHYPTTIEGRDTVISNNTLFPGNDLITKVNAIKHPNKELIKAELSKDKNFNHFSTPANIYTEIKLPIRKVIQDMRSAVGDKKLNINYAVLKVEGPAEDNEDSELSLPGSLILVDKKNVTDFAREIRPENLIFGELSQKLKQEKKAYVYSINIIPILTRAMKKAEEGIKEGKSLEESLEESFDMVLIPAKLLKVTNPQTREETLVGVAHQTAIRNLSILSGDNSTSPMKIDVVYNGF